MTGGVHQREGDGSERSGKTARTEAQPPTPSQNQTGRANPGRFSDVPEVIQCTCGNTMIRAQKAGQAERVCNRWNLAKCYSFKKRTGCEKYLMILPYFQALRSKCPLKSFASTHNHPVIEPTNRLHRVGLLTMVKNEDVFLASWLHHYKNSLKSPRFYIIDDASDEVSTAAIVRDAGAEDECSIIRLPPEPFSDKYKSSALSQLGRMLISRHNVLVISDVDEIVMPVGEARSCSLEDLLMATPAPFTSPIGVLPVHEATTETRFDPRIPLGDQRHWGYLHGASTKPIVWNGKAGEFTPGLHEIVGHNSPIITNLATMHLRFVDRDVFFERQLRRNQTIFSTKQGRNQGAHWKIDSEKMLQNMFLHPKKHIEGAPGLTDEAPRFVRAEMTKKAEGYVLKSRKSLQAVRLAGCI